jgi:hypothetical protein
MKRKYWLAVRLLALLAALIWVRHEPTERQLCNGYRMIRMNGAEVVIADPANRVITGGTATRWAAQCPYVTGYTRKEGFPPDTAPVEGYFLIDTSNRSEMVGMAETNWIEQMSAIHWEKPTMRETHVSLPPRSN